MGAGRKWFREQLNEALGGDKGIYLEHEATEVTGVKIFGTPYVADLCHLGFNKTIEKREFLWQLIPEDTELLITHMPPFGVLDGVLEEVVANGQARQEFIPEGCPALRERLGELNNLKCHVFGHIHECGGKTIDKDGIRFVNAAFFGTYREKRIGEMVVFEF